MVSLHQTMLATFSMGCISWHLGCLLPIFLKFLWSTVPVLARGWFCPWSLRCFPGMVDVSLPLSLPWLTECSSNSSAEEPSPEQGEWRMDRAGMGGGGVVRPRLGEPITASRYNWTCNKTTTFLHKRQVWALVSKPALRWAERPDWSSLQFKGNKIAVAVTGDDVHRKWASVPSCLTAAQNSYLPFEQGPPEFQTHFLALHFTKFQENSIHILRNLKYSILFSQIKTLLGGKSRYSYLHSDYLLN